MTPSSVTNVLTLSFLTMTSSLAATPRRTRRPTRRFCSFRRWTPRLSLELRVGRPPRSDRKNLETGDRQPKWITELWLETKLLEGGADLSFCRGRQTPEDVRDFWRKLHARLT